MKLLPKVTVDKQAPIGYTGKNKYMQSGFINKVAITPANLVAAQGLKHICPNQGGIYADKGYCAKPAKEATVKKNCHLAMKDKNRDKDH